MSGGGRGDPLVRYDAQVTTVMKEGKLFADTASGMLEVVSVNAAEMARLPYDLSEGLYVVGTGSTGAAEALGICGALLCYLPLLIFSYSTC